MASTLRGMSSTLREMAVTLREMAVTAVTLREMAMMGEGGVGTMQAPPALEPAPPKRVQTDDSVQTGRASGGST